MSTAADRAARASSGPRTTSDRDQTGMLSLEAVLLLPVIALLVVGLLAVAVVVRDVLLVHEGARAGARTAATTSGTSEVVAAVTAAVPELDVAVEVDPVRRGDGDLVTVTVRSERQLGAVTHPIRGWAIARVEPAVGTTAPQREQTDQRWPP